jgi:hypothetical protein
MDLPSVAQETERPSLSTGLSPAREVVREQFAQSVGTRQIRDPAKNPVGRRRSTFSPAFRQR